MSFFDVELRSVLVVDPALARLHRSELVAVAKVDAALLICVHQHHADLVAVWAHAIPIHLVASREQNASIVLGILFLLHRGVLLLVFTVGQVVVRADQRSAELLTRREVVLTVREFLHASVVNKNAFSVVEAGLLFTRLRRENDAIVLARLALRKLKEDNRALLDDGVDDEGSPDDD